MAQMIMEPPTDFATESRLAELSLKKTCIWEVLATNGLQCRNLCTGLLKHFIPYAEDCKVKVARYY